MPIPNSPERGQELTITFQLQRFCNICGVHVETQTRTWPKLDYEKMSKFGDPTIDKSALCPLHKNNPTRP